MECFNCHSPMQGIQRHQIHIEHCYTCGAYWFDGGELTTVLGGSGLDVSQLRSHQPGKEPDTCRWCGRVYAGGTASCEDCARPLGLCCPHGHGMMQIIEEQEIELDQCKTCHGIWFDGREFLELSRALQGAAGGASMAAKGVSATTLAMCQVCGARTGRDGLAMQGGLWRCTGCQGEVSEAADKARAENTAAWRSQERADRLAEGVVESVYDLTPTSLLGALVRWLDH